MMHTKTMQRKTVEEVKKIPAHEFTKEKKFISGRNDEKQKNEYKVWICL